MSASNADDPSNVLKDDPLLKQVPEVEGYKVLEPCVLYAKVGEGGMGAVYRGRHLNLDIDVAIKCLKNVLAEQSPAFVTRFQREARIAASVHHQNLVQVYDISHKNGVHYLVMEFVKGETARERVMRKKRLSESEACKVMVGAASGLAEAHSQRIVHRDIKPDNILISFDGKVKVSDLGLAKALEVDGSPSLTMGVMGTPQYMAPEQWDDAAVVGPQADVWALGATLYFLLTGEHAIPGGSMQQIYKKICVDPFPDIRLKLPTVSAELKAILDKCVQRDQKQRYADCRELLRDLGKLIIKDAPPLADAESGTFKVPPLLSPPPAETLGHIKVAIRGEDGAKVDLSRHTPAKVASKAEVTEPPAVEGAAATPAGARSSRWAWGAAAMVPALALVWWAFLREEPSVAAEGQEASTPHIENDPAKLAEPTPVQDGNDEEAKHEQAPSEQVADLDAQDIEEPPVEDQTVVPVVIPALPTILTLDGLDPFVREPVLVLAGQVENGGGPVQVLSADPPIDLPLLAELNAEGRFELSLPLRAEGKYSFVLSTTGGEEQPCSVTYDGTPPSLSMLGPKTVTSSTYGLEVEAFDLGSGIASVKLVEPPMDLVLRDGVWQTSLTLVEGENQLDVRAEDQAGNPAEGQLLVVVDSKGPNLLSINPDSNEELSPGKRRFDLKFSEPFSYLEIKGEPFSEGEVRGTAEVSLDISAEAVFELSWRVVDLAGNEASDRRTWNVRTKPTSPFGWKVDESKSGYSWDGASGSSYIARRHTDPKTDIAFVLVDNLGLYVAETEVTVAQFNRWSKASKVDAAENDLPITNVTWREANLYCKEFGYRLPTKQEWRAACLAGKSGTYCFGDGEKGLAEYAWHQWVPKYCPKEKPKEPQQVKQLLPNAFGLYDMHGNVWEWSQDDAPEGKNRKKKLGGSFANKADRCTGDAEDTAINGTSDTGFRPVRQIQ